MMTLADPSSQRLVMVLNAMETGKAGLTKGGQGVVKKYLCSCRKRRERRENLYVCCMEIVKKELVALNWNDKCFEDWVLRMIEGADVSQLEYFSNHYRTSKNKNVFFLGFVVNEL
jgi:hypothetical protein